MQGSFCLPLFSVQLFLSHKVFICFFPWKKILLCKEKCPIVFAILLLPSECRLKNEHRPCKVNTVYMYITVNFYIHMGCLSIIFSPCIKYALIIVPSCDFPFKYTSCKSVLLY